MLARFRPIAAHGQSLRRLFSSPSIPAQDLSEQDFARQELAKRAHREVQIARRRRREAEDEAILFESANKAGYFLHDADLGDEMQKRRKTIDRYMSAQAEAIMDVIAAKKPLSQAIDFTLEILPSRELPQPIAGDGVFVRTAGEGGIPVGRLLAFYPGSVYLPHEVRWLGGYGPTLERAKQHTSSHVIGRVGGVRIDGLWSDIEVPSAEFDLDDDRIEAAVARLEIEHDAGRNAARADANMFCAGLTSDHRSTRANIRAPDHKGDPVQLRILNPIAVGEMINHPPYGRSANVVGWPVDLNLFCKGEDRAAYARVAPNSYALRPEGAPAPGAPCPYTVVLVAAEVLTPGDELYLDYGCELLPVEDIPVWFAPASLRGNVGEKDPTYAPALAIRDELHAWRDSFESTHGRKPTRHDMVSDKVASALFQTFQKYRKLGDL